MLKDRVISIHALLKISSFQKGIVSTYELLVDPLQNIVISNNYYFKLELLHFRNYNSDLQDRVHTVGVEVYLRWRVGNLGPACHIKVTTFQSPFVPSPVFPTLNTPANCHCTWHDGGQRKITSPKAKKNN